MTCAAGRLKARDARSLTVCQAARDALDARVIPIVPATQSRLAGQRLVAMPTATERNEGSRRSSWQWRLPREEGQFAKKEQQTDREGPAVQLSVAHNCRAMNRRALHLIDVG